MVFKISWKHLRTNYNFQNETQIRLTYLLVNTDKFRTKMDCTEIWKSQFINQWFLTFLANYPFWWIWKPNYPQISLTLLKTFNFTLFLAPIFATKLLLHGIQGIALFEFSDYPKRVIYPRLRITALKEGRLILRMLGLLKYCIVNNYQLTCK